jgi:hypothetical protein
MSRLSADSISPGSDLGPQVGYPNRYFSSVTLQCHGLLQFYAKLRDKFEGGIVSACNYYDTVIEICLRNIKSDLECRTEAGIF